MLTDILKRLLNEEKKTKIVFACFRSAFSVLVPLFSSSLIEKGKMFANTTLKMFGRKRQRSHTDQQIIFDVQKKAVFFTASYLAG